MKAKEKTSRPAKSEATENNGLFLEMKISEMTDIDRKIHDLLTAMGYRVTVTERMKGMKNNNYTNVNRMEFICGERRKVIVFTHEPPKPKAEAGDIRIGHSGDALALLDEMIGDCEGNLSDSAQPLYKPKLEALRDAVERGTI
jgi:hypothetical protein